MFSKCPACGSLNVRRSSIRSFETSAKARLRSPYRCRDCGERFFTISRRARDLLSLAGILIVAGTVAWSMGGISNQTPHEPQPPKADAESLAEMIKSAKRDDPTAEFKLSQMYAHGSGVEADKKEAQTWLERAAQHGNVDAQYELGNALREGLGVVQDYERAAKWLERAAMNNHADAQYALGQMYRAGTGVPADNAKAYLWFNLAAAQDVAGAAVQRDAMLRVLTPAQVLEAQAEARRLSQGLGKQSAMVR